MKKPVNNDLLNSFKCAIKGIRYIFEHERNFRIHSIVGLFVLVFSVIIGLGRIDFCIILLTIALVLITEMVNSAIEYTWDKLEPNHHPVVAIIKDAVAGAVFVAVSFAVLVGILIFSKYF